MPSKISAKAKVDIDNQKLKEYDKNENRTFVSVIFPLEEILMRKLSILVALILCVTIGGVYATWMYPGNDIGQVIQPVSNVMAETDFTGSFGTYHTVENTLKLIIDQESSTSHNTVLKYEGKLVVTFTPHASISDAQLAAALGATVSVTCADIDSAVYGTDNKKIWELNENKFYNLTEADWGDPVEGVYTCTIDCTDLNEIITMANTFNLPTIDDYNAFQQVQKLAVFRVKITAQTPASNS